MVGEAVGARIVVALLCVSMADSGSNASSAVVPQYARTNGSGACVKSVAVARSATMESGVRDAVLA